MAAAILGTVRNWGPNSLCITIAPELRKQMGLVRKDVLAFRVANWQGKLILIGEKVPLHALANLKEVSTDMLPTREK